MNKILKIILIILGIIVILGILFFTIDYNRLQNEKALETLSSEQLNEEMYKSALMELPEQLSIEECVSKGYFVITTNKIYNKDILEKFIKNTGFNAKNRVEDKIRIVEYNYDGYPTIYDVEYKIFKETYINEEQKNVNKSGYILATDATRNNISPRDILVNTNIPGELYGITITEDEGINAAIISLSLYKQINYGDTNKKSYEDIEIARYLLTDEVINLKSKFDREVEKANQEIRNAFNEEKSILHNNCNL